MKTIEQHFGDWVSYYMGFGYGTGEVHMIGALKEFFQTTGRERGQYDFEELSYKLTPRVTWFLINLLCDACVIEYGVSPRFGWLTRNGMVLRNFVVERSLDDLVSYAARTEADVACEPDLCCCHGINERGRHAKKCLSPFFHKFG